jgi:hypothetical protein
MKKPAVAVLSVACLLVMIGQAPAELRPTSQNMAKRLALMQLLIKDITTNDFDKATSDAKALADTVDKDTKNAASSGLRDADTTLEKSIATFMRAAEKKDALTICSSYADILGSCYGCHSVYKRSK